MLSDLIARGGAEEARLSDALRRIANLLRLGKVAEADYAKARVRITVGDPARPHDHLLSDWLPWLTLRAGPDAVWWAPEVGETVLVLAPSGEMPNAVVLPALFSAANPAPADRETVHRMTYADGAVIEYDRAAGRLKADIPGDAELLAGGSVSVNAGADITIAAAGDVIISAGGNIAVSGTRIDLN